MYRNIGQVSFTLDLVSPILKTDHKPDILYQQHDWVTYRSTVSF